MGEISTQLIHLVTSPRIHVDSAPQRSRWKIRLSVVLLADEPTSRTDSGRTFWSCRGQGAAHGFLGRRRGIRCQPVSAVPRRRGSDRPSKLGVTAPRLGSASAASASEPPRQPTQGLTPTLRTASRRSASVGGVGARNSVVAGQAACWYSWMSSSQRVDFTTRRWLGSARGCSVQSGGRWSSERWGRCAL